MKTLFSHAASLLFVEEAAEGTDERNMILNVDALVGNRVKVETRKQGLAIHKYQFRTAAKR